MRGGIAHRTGTPTLTQFLTFHLQVTAKKAGNKNRISTQKMTTSESEETSTQISEFNFGGIVRAVLPLMRSASTPQTLTGGITMKHRNIQSKADRVQLKRKHDTQLPPHKRKAGLSFRKTKAFLYDVFEDGLLIGQLRRD